MASLSTGLLWVLNIGQAEPIQWEYVFCFKSTLEKQHHRNYVLIYSHSVSFSFSTYCFLHSFEMFSSCCLAGFMVKLLSEKSLQHDVSEMAQIQPLHSNAIHITLHCIASHCMCWVSETNERKWLNISASILT